MNIEKEKKLNKNNKALLYIARELIFSEKGDRILPVLEYSSKYGISVGIIQKALMTLQNEGVIECEKRGVLGTFIKKIDNKKLLEKSELGFLVGAMPLPYSKRYEGLAMGIKSSFQKQGINYYFAYMSGSKLRMNLLEKGIYDFAVISKLTYKIEKEKNENIESVFDFGEGSYVSKHVLLKAPGVKSIKKIGIDKNSEDQEYLTMESFKNTDYKYVEIEYNETLRLLKNRVVDGIIWNLDEIKEKQIDIKYEELGKSKVLKEASEAVLVVNKKNRYLKKIAQKVIDKNYVIEMQRKVLKNEVLPVY